jgi:mRNA-degrading endonuclease YafQ of YafQ-DinJ toxin-antitoxin module
MYLLFVANSKTEKILNDYINYKKDIKSKLDKLRENPYKFNNAHKLAGRLNGKWACWLGSNIRCIYTISEINKSVIVEAVGTHKIY